MRNLKLTLAYDGAGFHGWQRQPGLRTVQEAVEESARRVLRHPLFVIGASRTDAGVHAVGQVANIQTTSDIPLHSIRRAIGARLPHDTSLVDIAEAPAEFHATRGARAKQYRYRVFASSRRPVEELVQRYSYHVWYPLDLDRLIAAAALLTGRHDFTAMASKGSQRESNVRTVFSWKIYRVGSEIWLDVEGDGFLYNQVRNMVGTLIEVGRFHWPVERIPEILASQDRQQAGPTAPAHALCLRWVRYDDVSTDPTPVGSPSERPA